MPKFEYILREVEIHYTTADAQPAMTYREGAQGGGYITPSIDELGKKGWELIHLEPFRKGPSLAVFKRKQSEP